jgi:perosamine synthetase
MVSLISPQITDTDKKQVLKAIESGWLNTTGPYVEKLEKELQKVTKTKKATLLANGTSALFMALKSLGIGPGDKVLVPSITFVATINSILHAGAEPIFVDCGKDLNIDPEKVNNYLKTKNTHKIKAIIPVHIFGNPCEMTKIKEIAKQYKLFIIEDSCEALGSFYNGTPCGGIGDIGVFSFSFNKIITSGNGGAIVTNNIELGEKIRYWITQSKDDPINYIHNEVGYNLGLTNLQAALGYSQIKRLSKIIKKKQKITEKYKSFLGKKIIHLEGSNCWLVGYDCKNNRDQLFNTLKKKNIQTRPLWYPNHLQKPFRNFEKASNMRNTLLFSKRILNLPCGLDLSNKDITRICSIIQNEELICH